MPKRLPDDVLDYFRKEGARGGKIGAKRMTAAERSARGKKGAAARALKAKARKG